MFGNIKTKFRFANACRTNDYYQGVSHLYKLLDDKKWKLIMKRKRNIEDTFTNVSFDDVI